MQLAFPDRCNSFLPSCPPSTLDTSHAPPPVAYKRPCWLHRPSHSTLPSQGRVSKPRRGRSTNRRGVTFHPDLVTGRQSPEMASTPTSVDGACKVPRRSVVRGLIGYALSLFGYREREEM